MKLTLKVDGTPCAVDCRQGISLSLGAVAAADIASARTGRRVRLRVESTAATDRLFGNAADPLTAEHFNDTLHRGEIAADGMVIFSGTVRLVGAERLGSARSYEIEMIDGGAGWAKAAAQRSIADAGVEFSAIFTPDEICRGWSDDSPVKFLPVHRDSYELENSSASMLPAEKIMMTDDYHPFISVGAVVRAIFADAGYDVESRFMESPLFGSLYMSGGYASGDASGKRRTMDFVAGRTSDASATADFFGRVYVAAAVGAHTVGNIVETADEFVEEPDGRLAASGFYSKNGCFGVENGEIVFRPVSAVTAGFEYSIAYVTDHEIESRRRLRGFDTLYLGNGLTVPYSIANRYTDHREAPLPRYGYKLTVFDADGSCDYRLSYLADGVRTTIAETSERMTAVTMPAVSSLTDGRLERAPKGSSSFAACDEDWALYSGYVELRGQTELEIKVRTPPENLSPSSPKRFNQIYFEGARSGMTFKLLRRTTLRPLFSEAIGFGSAVKFADVAQTGMSQGDLLEALVQMFNLRFCTDERAKKVFVEPYDDLFGGGETDWTGKIDRDSPQRLTDPSLGVHEKITLGYRDGDGTVARFDARSGGRFGRWSFRPGSRATLEGEQVKLNRLFAPTLSVGGKYADAQSALVMQVLDRDEESGDELPRIVRYVGLHPLPEGQMWGYPFMEQRYPLAAFHFAGDKHAEPFTLCFEDRDGAQGLNSFHCRQMEEESAGPELAVWLHLTPEDMAGLLAGDGKSPSVRSLYRLEIGGQSALWTLRAVEGYDPQKSLTLCRFLKTAENR